MANLDQIMDYVADGMTPIHEEITPTRGQPHTSWGGCSYSVYGKIVVINMGLNSLTASTGQNVYTMPVGLRPKREISVIGGAQTTATFSTWTVYTDGNINVWTPNAYANVTIVYCIE